MLRSRRRSTPKNLAASPGPLSAWHAGRTSGLRQKAIQTDLRPPGRSGSFADQIAELDQAGCDTYLTINTLDGDALRPGGAGRRIVKPKSSPWWRSWPTSMRPPSRAITTPRSSKSTTRFSRCPAIRRCRRLGTKNGGLPRLLAARQAFPHPDQADRHRIKNLLPPLAGIAQSKLDGREYGQHLRSGARAAAHRLHQP